MAVDDEAVAATLSSLLDARAPPSTICPSEVARALAPTDEAAWRALMPQVRRVASKLATEGVIRVTRRGEVVDAEAPGGPIRIGRPQP